MAAPSRTLEVRVVTDTRDYEQGMDRVAGSADKTAQQTGSRFGQMASAAQLLLAGTVVTSLVAVASKLNDLALLSEGVGRRFDTVFGETAEAMRAWVDDQNEAFGLSEVALQGLAAGVQDLLVPLGFTRTEAAEMTKTVLETANALSEWTGGTVTAESAINTLRKAMLGEREELKALGVSIGEAEVQTRLFAKGQQDLTGEALAQAKAQVTLEAILQKSTDALTAYGNAGETALRTQKEVTATAADLTQQLADLAAPTFASATAEAGLLADAVRIVSSAFGDATTGGIDLTTSVKEGFPLWQELSRVMRWATETIDDKAAADAEAEQAQRDLIDVVEEGEQSFLDAAAAILTATDALSDYRTAQQEALDPVMAVVGAIDRYNDAADTANRLLAEGKGNTVEYSRANLDLLEAQAGLNGAVATYNDLSPDQLEAFRTLAAEAGPDVLRVLDDILDTINTINATPANVRIDVDGGGGPGGGPGILQHGGPFFRDRTYWVGERGPEPVRFTSPGVVTAAQDAPRRQAGSAPLIGTIILQGTPADLARRVAEQVAREARFSL